jgi:lipoprotein-anchoring transpeptidase ErfK/SrfK
VPPEKKRIEVSLATQELFCYEFDELVLRTVISSGIPTRHPSTNGIPTVTPEGRFFVEVKMPSRHMGDGELTSDIFAYELPGVPWVSFFTSTGVALHGVYWHNDFGRRKSHGCVNMRADEAKWLYRWTLPVIKPHESQRIARGTPVLVY